jgi:hypothetical protein
MELKKRVLEIMVAAHWLSSPWFVVQVEKKEVQSESTSFVLLGEEVWRRLAG